MPWRWAESCLYTGGFAGGRMMKSTRHIEMRTGLGRVLFLGEGSSPECVQEDGCHLLAAILGCLLTN